MRLISPVVAGLALLCAAAPASALTVAYPAGPFARSGAHFAFSGAGQIDGFVAPLTADFLAEAYVSDLAVIFTGTGAQLRTFAPPGGGVLPVFQMYTFSDASFTATLNGASVDWDEELPASGPNPANYSYYNAFNLTMLPGENVFVLSATHAPLPSGELGIGFAQLTSGSFAIPAPAALPLLLGGMAALFGLRARSSA
jgi:hypothetical protein